jgi:hypothetical protein
LPFYREYLHGITGLFIQYPREFTARFAVLSLPREYWHGTCHQGQTAEGAEYKAGERKMCPISTWDGIQKLNVPKALRSGHDEARSELVRATMEGGRIAKAAKRVAQLCLPHFEHEERSVFPILTLLPHLSPKTLRPEMMEVMPLISRFRSKHDAMNHHHQSILSAIDGLVQAAYKEKNREFAEFAYNLRDHERIEDEVIYPTVFLIGDYLQEKFSH